MENENILWEPARNVEENKTTLPPMHPDTQARSAGFQTCCIADFQVGKTLKITRFAGLETRDTADLEVCATGTGSKCTTVWTRSDRFGHCVELHLLRDGSAGFARLAPFVQVRLDLFHG
jgi:hypothetical protein